MTVGCRSRGGLTFIEITISTLIGIVLLSTLWQIFLGDQRRYIRDENRLTGLQGVLLLDERLGSDLERIALDVPDRPPPTAPDPDSAARRFDINHPFDLDGPDGIRFRIYGDDSIKEGSLGTLPVRWYLDHATGKVSRDQGGRITVIRSLRATDLTFMKITAPMDPTRLGMDLPVTPPGEIHLLRYQVTCQPEWTPRGGAGQPSVTLSGSFPLTRRTRMARHDYFYYGSTELLDRGGS